MRIIFSIILFLFFISNSFCQDNKPKLVITHLINQFYVFTTFNTYKNNLVPANGMYFITDKGAILFDTPWDTTQFQQLLDSILIKHHKKVILCIATHFHDDRTAGLEYYTSKGIRTFTTLYTDSLSKMHHAKRASFTIDRDTIFTIGKYTFQTFYPGKGHSPDNIVIWVNKYKILYGGCFIKSEEATDLGNLGDANVNEWATSIKRVAAKFTEPQFIIPGHGSWTNKNVLKHNAELINSYLKTHTANK